jgi:hypothetical protein
MRRTADPALGAGARLFFLVAAMIMIPDICSTEILKHFIDVL